MKFEPSFINEVRARTSLVALIGRDVKLTRNGREHTGLCPFHAEKTSSFTVNEKKGFYHCFGCSAHGDVFAYLMNNHGLSFVDAVQTLAVEAGLRPDNTGHKLPKPKPVIPRQTSEEAEKERHASIAWARSIWASCQKADNTLVEDYLLGRGIDLSKIKGIPPTIRFHSGLKHQESERVFPAMVSAIQNADRQVVGIHRTFISVEKAEKYPVVDAVLQTFNGARITRAGELVTKAPVKPAKKTGGVPWGGAIRFAKPAEKLWVAEGIESALSILAATGGKVPVWAAFALGNLVDIRFPKEVKEIVLCVDSDEKDPEKAEAVKQRAARRHAENGLKVSFARPDKGKDFNDMLLEAV